MFSSHDLPASLVDRVTARLQQLRLSARSLRRAIDDLEEQTNLTLERFGIPKPNPKANDAVVDVGRRPVAALVKGAARGVALVVSFVALGLALLSLGVFVGAAALAFMLITRGLGLRVGVAGA